MFPHPVFVIFTNLNAKIRFIKLELKETW